MEELDTIKEIINDYFINIENIDYEYFSKFEDEIIATSNMIDDINPIIIKKYISKLVKNVFILNENSDCPIIYNKDDVKIPKKFNSLVKHVDYIENLPQPVQRSTEWFNMRKNMITASNTAQALGKSHWGSQNKFVLDKLGLGEPFKTNKYCHHGVKYEPISTMMYENLYNIQIKEYGLIPHLPNPKILFLGASPDGIGSIYKMDNSFSPLIGRMLEIKCPYSRKLILEGKIDGEICPYDYYCQVQQQLECCDLEYCDFWQTIIEEVSTREEWLNIECNAQTTEEQNQPNELVKNCQKGCIIQLLPKEKINRFCLFEAKYIYPPDINISIFDYDKWVLDEIHNLHIKYPELMDNYVFDRIIYWNLKQSHNVTIKRDREWFNEILPELKSIWDKIKYFRENKDEAQKLVPKKKKKILFIDSESGSESGEDD